MSHETLLKPRDYKRDALGMFERPGATLKNTQKDKLKKKPEEIKSTELVTNSGGHGGLRKGAGRPPGVPNKITTALKEAILQAAENAGGDEGIVGYLSRLAIENSSAFAGLLGKVLPTTLNASESDGGLGVKMVFERHIVWPDGHREIEGVTPKALPAPSPVSVESNDQLICAEKPSQNSASDDQ
jgi:hypothetical protein